MAWIIVSANGEELDRRELSTPVVVGRSSECDVAIRDILLSRHHCRLEPVGHDWQVVDLKSKNGTRVGWQQVSGQVLKNGDHLRMGRTRIIFYTTPFEPAPERKPRTDRMVRPADPHEALSGTVTDFVYVDEHEPHDHIDHHPQAELPVPKPRPLDPASYSEPQVESLIDDLASSFWYRQGDATAPTGGGSAATHTLAPTRTVARALPRIPAKTLNRLPRRTTSETDFSLQVDHEPLPEAKPLPPKRSRKYRVAVAAALTIAAALGTGIVVMSLWLLTLSPK
jgi:predicted component of type VI protein secretion system